MFLPNPFFWLARRFGVSRPTRRLRPYRPSSVNRTMRMVLERLEGREVPAGTWTALTNLAPNSVAGSGLFANTLEPNGDVLAHNAGLSANPATPALPSYQVDKEFLRLIPDSNGDFINGTWSTGVAPMGTARLGFPSGVLPNGDLFVAGGEYSGPTDHNFVIGVTPQEESNTGEILDPVANSWNQIANFPFAGAPNYGSLGDVPTAVLHNGQILVGDNGGPATYLYTLPTAAFPAGSWAPTGTKLHPASEISNEETWVSLPDGSVLSYDVWSSANDNTFESQRYMPSTGLMGGC